MTADEIVDRLKLAPHPEGGWYREGWRGPGDPRASGTAIWFLLKAGERSHWHRVDADELWLWHAGAPLTLWIAETAEGPPHELCLGPGLDVGALPRHVVPAGWWQSAESTGGWTLVSCVVIPGFVFEGFELAPPDFGVPDR